MRDRSELEGASEGKKAKKRAIYAWVFAICFFIAVFAPLFFGVGALTSNTASQLAFGAFYIGLYCLMAACALKGYSWEVREGFARFVREPLKAAALLICGVGLNYLFSAVFYYLAEFLGASNPGTANVPAINQLLDQSLAFVFIYIGIFTPFIEECFFRGFLIGKFRRKAPLWLLVILSSVIFALGHTLDFSPTGLLGTLPQLGIGLIYGMIYAYSSNLAVPVLIHMINNLVAILLLVLGR